MHLRTFPRTGWRLSEVGFGTWGMGGWTGSDDTMSLAAIERALDLGCTFFDTAWAYGAGRSEKLLARVFERRGRTGVFVATKVPPKNMRWPGCATDAAADVYPADHIRAYTEESLRNLGVDVIDLQQLHVWSDAWADDPGWQRAVEDLKREGLIRAFGISVNRWEPINVRRALATGLVDAVQVVYNIFDQAPEDELFPLCQQLNVAVIARVPFDEGSLTGTLTRDSRWPEGDWRNLYFAPDNLNATLDRVSRLESIVPAGMTLPDLALRFILRHPAVTTVIPGMRTPGHVEANLSASDGPELSPGVVEQLRTFRWDRVSNVP